ncbi:hypothetical protein K0M31_017675 [Melipona bicolor]|uniref:Uncharacterized protein n=1 Tax=Melipona bicolor TaxID=60889 RepID=A0AA40G5B8_9HYME|nr:hypothetical protein K0M31_017675 [Melipona bicolor]
MERFVKNGKRGHRDQFRSSSFKLYETFPFRSIRSSVKHFDLFGRVPFGMPRHCALSKWNGPPGVAAFLRAILVVPLSLTNVGRGTGNSTQARCRTRGQTARYEQVDTRRRLKE